MTPQRAMSINIDSMSHKTWLTAAEVDLEPLRKDNCLFIWLLFTNSFVRISPRAIFEDWSKKPSSWWWLGCSWLIHTSLASERPSKSCGAWKVDWKRRETSNVKSQLLPTFAARAPLVNCDHDWSFFKVQRKNASIKMEKKLGYNIYQCQMVSSGVVSNGVEWCGVKWCQVSVMTLESLYIYS